MRVIYDMRHSIALAAISCHGAATVLLIADDTMDLGEQGKRLLEALAKDTARHRETLSSAITLSADMIEPKDIYFEGIPRGRSNSPQPFYRGLKKYRKP